MSVEEEGVRKPDVVVDRLVKGGAESGRAGVVYGVVIPGGWLGHERADEAEAEKGEGGRSRNAETEHVHPPRSTGLRLAVYHEPAPAL